MAESCAAAAERLKDVAEEQFKSGDIKGSRSTAGKAYELFPSLPGLTHMIAALDVHIAAATGNWHAVLGVQPSADPDTIKKQLKKMRLLTHPDKNKSAAATEAFSFVEEAAAHIREYTEQIKSSIPQGNCTTTEVTTSTNIEEKHGTKNPTWPPDNVGCTNGFNQQWPNFEDYYHYMTYLSQQNVTDAYYANPQCTYATDIGNEQYGFNIRTSTTYQDEEHGYNIRTETHFRQHQYANQFGSPPPPTATAYFQKSAPSVSSRFKSTPEARKPENSRLCPYQKANNQRFTRRGQTPLKAFLDAKKAKGRGLKEEKEAFCPTKCC